MDGAWLHRLLARSETRAIDKSFSFTRALAAVLASRGRRSFLCVGMGAGGVLWAAQLAFQPRIQGFADDEGATLAPPRNPQLGDDDFTGVYQSQCRASAQVKSPVVEALLWNRNEVGRGCGDECSGGGMALIGAPWAELVFHAP